MILCWYCGAEILEWNDVRTMTVPQYEAALESHYQECGLAQEGLGNGSAGGKVQEGNT